MGNLIPNQPLIYERANDVVYARYRDPPYNTIPRWVVGGDTKQEVLDYTMWREIVDMAKEHPTLNDQLEQLLTAYYLCKETT